MRERDNRSRLLISRGVADLRRPLSQQRALYWPIGSHKNRLVDISGDSNCGRNHLIVASSINVICRHKHGWIQENGNNLVKAN